MAEIWKSCSTRLSTSNKGASLWGSLHSLQTSRAPCSQNQGHSSGHMKHKKIAKKKLGSDVSAPQLSSYGSHTLEHGDV